MYLEKINSPEDVKKIKYRRIREISRRNKKGINEQIN